ncbi:MAG: prefoldin subunit beta [Hadesarchaea archaeon]|nr:MAG: prefoldin subunit beta [Hadesarchaea archaeon]
MENLSPQLRHQIAQFRQVQQQVQMLLSQRQQVELLLKETERALEELGKLSDDAVVYKSVGTLLVRSEKSTLQKNLTEQKESLELRVKTLQRQEERAVQRLREMHEKIDEALKSRGLSENSPS